MAGLGSAFGKVTQAKDAVERAKSTVKEAASKAKQALDAATDEGGKWLTVKEGDWIMQKADEFGLPNWQKIWNDAKNKGLREQRIHPNILQPGDRLFIPDIIEKIEDGASEMRHRFTKPVPKAIIRLVLENQDKEKLVGVGYILKIKDEIFQGVTDGMGKIEHELPLDAKKCQLRFDGAAADTIKFLQPGLIAPQLGSDYNTLRAFYKTPLDPEFTAGLRLQAKKFVAGVSGMLQGQVDGVVAKGADLINYCNQNANSILDQIADAEAKAKKLADDAAGQIKDKTGELADQGRGLIDKGREQVDKAGSMAAAMEAQAQKMADEAAGKASAVVSNVTDRADEMAAGFDQKVDAAMGKMIAAEQKARDKISGTADQARGEVDRRVAQGQEAARGVERRVQESINEAQTRYDEGVQQGVDQGKAMVDEAAETAKNHIEEMIDRNADRATSYLKTRLGEARNRVKEGVGQAADKGREAYAKGREQVDDAADQAEAKSRGLVAEFGRMMNQA
ncbi:MAG: hypothetical protein IIB60_03045, partial [Planctomycetes bacterium]|nr:hypothetical protein [Planctomycetota bacterium]